MEGLREKEGVITDGGGFAEKERVEGKGEGESKQSCERA